MNQSIHSCVRHGSIFLTNPSFIEYVIRGVARTVVISMCRHLVSLRRIAKMGIGARGVGHSLGGGGGSRGLPPRNFFYAIFKIKFLVISYLAKLFIFEWFVQIRVYAWSELQREV